MVPSKKMTDRLKRSVQAKTSGIFSFVAKRPFLSLLIIAALPFVLLVVFTLKGGYDLPVGKSSKANKIIVAKTPTELADQATAFLQKRDTQSFLELLDKQIKSNVNIVNGKGDPLIVAAATLGNTEAVKRLILSGVDVNKRNAFTRDTALIRSLYYTDNTEIAQMLVSYGADINAVNNYKQSPLFVALEKRRGDLIDLFLSHGVKEGLSAEYLFRACAAKNHMGVLAMLKGGIDPNVANDKGNTPLIISASLGDLASVRDLLAYRADINAANKDGNTALIYAARYNHPQVVRELLKPQTMQVSVDVNAQNKLGQTALYWAAAKGYVDIVTRLLAADADTTLAAKDHLIPYMAAKRNRRTAVLPWFEKNLIEVKNSVIEEDNAALTAEAKAQGRDLPSAQEEAAAIRDEDIFKAARNGDADLARRVIEQNKAVVFDKNREGDSPLLIAVANGHTEVVDVLLRNAARLFEASAKGNIFHISVETQNMKMLKHLVQMARQEGRLAMMLEYKANLKGQKQLTPLGLAALNCNKEMYDYLVSIGAKPGVHATSANILGTISPVDLMAKCKAKPIQAKKLTNNTRRAITRKPATRRAVSRSR
ncbi:MAG: ankyrin repeat domain-containing protein [Elusimicrobiaceae bacterium]|nr:ankyrin repeat domain-containing protein [Elusimicrobiaceae bacterium]